MKSNGDSLKESVSDSQDGMKEEKPSPSKPPVPVRQTSFPVAASDTADQVRLKCRELLTNALKIEGKENTCRPGFYHIMMNRLHVITGKMVSIIYTCSI